MITKQSKKKYHIRLSPFYLFTQYMKKIFQLQCFFICGKLDEEIKKCVVLPSQLRDLLYLNVYCQK